jgi:hypothetical protein
MILPVLLISIILQSTIYSQIRLILTAALPDAHFAWRQKQYLESFKRLYRYGYRKNDFYIVEALRKHGPTFLRNHCDNVYYAKNNNPHFKNNGINEAITLLEAFNYFNFDDEDMIIKMTGRYWLMNNNFFTLVHSLQNSVDAIVCWYKEPQHRGAVYTSLIAMKCKYFKEMIAEFDYDAMDQQWTVLEHAVGGYLRHKVANSNFKLLTTDTLGIEAHFFGSTTLSEASGIAYQ